MTAAPGRPAARYDDWAGWYERYLAEDARGFTQRTGRALREILGPGSRLPGAQPGPAAGRDGANHLPVSNLLNALTAAGLTIERVIEAGDPVPDILAVRCRCR